jgi:2-succinyl-5-enolpyruvyl-6-hydroxy-3-cyclohexene-1-carboxylate synthase
MTFENMSLKELWQFWFKDWEQDAPELENTDTMREWEDATDKAIGNATTLELLEALHIVDKESEWLDQVADMRKKVFQHICEPLQEQVNQIEISVKLLLKELEDEQSSITIGKLNRLKGGI